MVRGAARGPNWKSGLRLLMRLCETKTIAENGKERDETMSRNDGPRA